MSLELILGEFGTALLGLAAGTGVIAMMIYLLNYVSELI